VFYSSHKCEAVIYFFFFIFLKHKSLYDDKFFELLVPFFFYDCKVSCFGLEFFSGWYIFKLARNLCLNDSLSLILSVDLSFR
jgi:hypothetical protein